MALVPKRHVLILNTEANRLFAKHGDRLLELHKLTSNSPQSWFIDQTVHSDGGLLLGTPVDPLFVLFGWVAAEATDRSVPLDQLLSPQAGGDASHRHMLQGCAGLEPALLCDVDERFGPERALLRASEEKCLRWLRAKATRAVRALTEEARRVAEVERRAASAVGDSGFVPPSNGAAIGGGGGGEGREEREEREERRHRGAALEILASYVGEEWAEKVREAMGWEKEVEKEKVEKTKTSKWNEVAAADAAAGGVMMAATGRGKRGADGHLKGGPTKKKRKKEDAAPPTGMKSLTAFFGKKS